MGAYGDLPNNGPWGHACHLERNTDVNMPDNTWTGNATGRRHVCILKNGTTIVAGDNIPALSGGGVFLIITALIPLTVGDFLTIEVWQNSGAKRREPGRRIRSEPTSSR